MFTPRRRHNAAQGLNVLVGIALTPQELDVIRAAAPGAAVRYFGDQAQAAFEGAIEDAEVIVLAGDGNAVSPSALARATHLRWIHSWAATPYKLLYREMIDSHVVVTSSVGSGAIGMAEHALMLMLILNSGALHWVRAQAEHRWERRPHPELNGLTCGIIGLGHTGQDLAAKLRAFHMRVLGIRRTPGPTPNVDEIFTRERLREFLSLSDFVVVTAPLTVETANMLDEPEFKAMKPTAYYICSSRGGIANETALLRALNEGWIAGAGLDAFSEEVLPPGSPFWEAANTIVTPHIGAFTPRRRRASLDMFVANLRRYIAGEPLANVVDKQVGY